MVYKIQSEFGEGFSIILSKLSEYFDFIYTNNALYLGLRSYENFDNHEIFMKKILRPAKKYLIIKVNENTLKNEPPNVIEWCRDKFVELDRQRFEINEQDKLHKYMQAMDIFEKEMQELAKKQSIKDT